MALLNRHKFSKDEISKLEDIVKKSEFDVECAEKALGKLKRSKSFLDLKQKQDQHNYRLKIFTFSTCSSFTFKCN